MFFQLRVLGKFSRRPGGWCPKGTSPFSHVIHGLLQLVIVRLEKLVQIVELWSRAVPVVVVGLVYNIYSSASRSVGIWPALPVGRLNVRCWEGTDLFGFGE
jgi:hypothetical protein